MTCLTVTTETHTVECFVYRYQRTITVYIVDNNQYSYMTGSHNNMTNIKNAFVYYFQRQQSVIEQNLEVNIIVYGSQKRIDII